MKSKAFWVGFSGRHSAFSDKSGSGEKAHRLHTPSMRPRAFSCNPLFSSKILECQEASQAGLAHKELESGEVSLRDFACFASEDAGSYLSGNDQVRMKQSSKSTKETSHFN